MKTLLVCGAKLRSKLDELLCDGFMEGRKTFGFMERCECKAKYHVTQENGPLDRWVCGRHVQTFRAWNKKGMKYVIKNIVT